MRNKMQLEKYPSRQRRRILIEKGKKKHPFISCRLPSSLKIHSFVVLNFMSQLSGTAGY